MNALSIEQQAQASLAEECGGVELIGAATIKPERVRWLWPGWLARGKLHVLAGAPGTGKTTIVTHIGACVSAGRALPSGWRPDRGNIIVWSGEDDPADTLVPRLIAAGADLARVRFVTATIENGERYPFDPARDVDKLAAAVAGIDNLAMIVVDPLVSAVSGDSHKNAEVRRGLAPLVDLAARLDAALIGITHYSKGTAGRDPLERVTGSVAFGALARLVFGTVRQEGEEGEPRRMMFARAKSNIGPDGGGFIYTFEQTELPDGIEASRIVWGEAVEGTARELLADPEPGGEHGNDAATFLRDLLAEGPMPVKEVFLEAEGAGYSRDQMKRAKAKIGAEAIKEGGDFGGKGARWIWALPSTRERETHKGALSKGCSLVENALPCEAEPEAVTSIRHRLTAICLRNDLPGEVARELPVEDVQACAGLDDGVLLNYVREQAGIRGLA